MKKIKKWTKWTKKPITWGGYIKYCVVCFVIGLVTSIVQILCMNKKFKSKSEDN